MPSIEKFDGNMDVWYLYTFMSLDIIKYSVLYNVNLQKIIILVFLMYFMESV